MMPTPILQIRKLRHKTVKQLVQLSGPSQNSNQEWQFQRPHWTSVLYVYLVCVGVVGGGGGNPGREEEEKKEKQLRRYSYPPCHTHLNSKDFSCKAIHSHWLDPQIKMFNFLLKGWCLPQDIWRRRGKRNRGPGGSGVMQQPRRTRSDTLDLPTI